jgi:glycosyltransferase involved in cell wall biosynthesis
MSIIAIIPAKNEEKTINEVVKKVREYCDFVYVFDDGSTDNTKFVKGVDGIISNPVNLGKGNTLRGAMLWLFWNKLLRENDIVILIDSECIPEILEFMKDNDMVVGSRDLKNYPFRKRFGNWFLSRWCSLLAGSEIKDSESGFRAIHVPLLKDILKYSSSRRYAVEMEMNIIAGRLGYKVKFIPVSSSYIVGKGVTVKDGILNAIGGVVCYCKMKMNGK